MKGLWAALILLVGVAILVTANAQFVAHTQKNLALAVEACPPVPSADATGAIGVLRKQFDKSEKTLSLSVNFHALNRINELIVSLEAYASADDASSYAATRALLLDALKDLTRLEKISWDRIF